MSKGWRWEGRRSCQRKYSTQRKGEQKKQAPPLKKFAAFAIEVNHSVHPTLALVPEWPKMPLCIYFQRLELLLK